jgi:hypothetical protein
MTKPHYQNGATMDFSAFSLRQAIVIYRFSSDERDGGFAANEVLEMYGNNYKRILERLKSAGLIIRVGGTKRGLATQYQITTEGYRFATWIEKQFT